MLTEYRGSLTEAHIFDFEQSSNASIVGLGAYSLPDLDRNGFLPPGIHHSTIAEIFPRFVTSARRLALWNGSMAFLSRSTASGDFSSAYFAGGFVSTKPSPSDVDLILEPSMPYGLAALKAMEPFFAQGLDAILDSYSVHLDFWCRGFPNSIWDRREFFQEFKPRDVLRLGLRSEARRGIVQIDLRETNRAVPPSLDTN